jgi:hypothetical protein
MMTKTVNSLLAAFFLLLGVAGCSSTQQVTLARQSINHDVKTVFHVRSENDSSDMDKNLDLAIQHAGLQLKGVLPAGTVQSDKADALISYYDVWRWDLVMYLKSVRINLFDAKSGDLLVTGSWDNSALHSFPNSTKIVDDLVHSMHGPGSGQGNCAGQLGWIAA